MTDMESWKQFPISARRTDAHSLTHTDNEPLPMAVLTHQLPPTQPTNRNTHHGTNHRNCSNTSNDSNSHGHHNNSSNHTLGRALTTPPYDGSKGAKRSSACSVCRWSRLRDLLLCMVRGFQPRPVRRPLLALCVAMWVCLLLFAELLAPSLSAILCASAPSSMPAAAFGPIHPARLVRCV
jgi:hypothetical protein